MATGCPFCTRDPRAVGRVVIENCGEAGGQSIHHLHAIPRFADEAIAGKGIRHWLKSAANQRPSR